MSDPEAVLRTRDLTKSYRDFWGRERVQALHPLSLEVRRGEVFGLLGPNGSGKTTTIKLLLGLIRPSSGHAFVFGRDPGDLEARRRLGYLPEETYLHRFLTADETLSFYGGLFGLGGAELRRRIDQLIERVGLGHARHRRLGEYSKGMARRLGLAQALINQPELVILDEPTSGLDPIGSAEVKDLILELKRQGVTVLLCSHLLADVEDVCDRVVILYRGQVQEMGSIDSLLTDDRRMQVVLDDPDEATLAAVRAAAGDKLVAVERPRERLDRRFRDILARAQGKDASQP
jgi:ABC-2 type transport system ATP-binding protein